mmetsp:Transcript_114292/g.324273  ORF Transcript_114292/g.324273 Transcript_114292/m.324273 type:complete len:248 (+) Transcript_114292:679-1422(+)
MYTARTCSTSGSTSKERSRCSFMSSSRKMFTFCGISGTCAPKTSSSSAASESCTMKSSQAFALEPLSANTRAGRTPESRSPSFASSTPLSSMTDSGNLSLTMSSRAETNVLFVDELLKCCRKTWLISVRKSRQLRMGCTTIPLGCPRSGTDTSRARESNCETRRKYGTLFWSTRPRSSTRRQNVGRSRPSRQPGPWAARAQRLATCSTARISGKESSHPSLWISTPEDSKVISRRVLFSLSIRTRFW